MKTISLPAGAEHVQFDELAHLIAIALHPEGDGDTIECGLACCRWEAELLQAVRTGALPVKDPLTFGPHTFPVGAALRRSLVMVDDLRTFLVGRFNVAVEPQAEAPAVGMSGAPAWAVTRPQRYQGYASPLHRFLSAAHRDGKPRPSARDVIEEWRVRQPAEIAQVMPDGVNYYDSKGNTKAADLEAIRKSIDRMTSAR